MSDALAAIALMLSLALPLGLALLWALPTARAAVGRVATWAPLPALLLALFTEPGPSVSLDWILLGTRLGLTETTRVFLLFTAVLWLGAGMYARGYLHDDPRRPRFELFWLLTLAGNLGLILALDAATFYASFALMTFAAYGLVVHTGRPDALRAGRIYLVMAVLGEALLLAGLLLAAGLTDAPLLPLLAELPAAVAGATHRDMIVALLWLGFGIKAGLPLLHLWLPLAHPVAPVPASAVLSGAMIKAGLLGWLHTLPLGLLSLPAWGTLAIVAGLIAAFGAAFLALHQQHPKTVLAYSSISQMGLITVGVGAALYLPELWPLLGPAIALYAFHHGLAKGALFLGVGIARHPGGLARPWLWLLLALPALSLTGLMTSGVLAKLELKYAIDAARDAPAWWPQLPFWLALAAAGTTLIMARYLWLLRSESKGDTAPDTMWWGWGIVLAGSLMLVFLLPVQGLDEPAVRGVKDLIGLTWPVLAGTLLALAGARWLRPWPIPPGDLLALLPPVGQAIARLWRRTVSASKHAARRVQVLRRQSRQRSGRLFRPDRLWQREAGIVFAAVLAAALGTALL
ncbi:proton-conducting transporter transmembrane domain-containing protein [Thioalkalivibrio paradoxus]|uniref:NADH-ubiquinone oxidoreductase n=1 Tax=Thioalkalivibrio paradoxus ARh 1 TaxID=713585 RepID=W0DEB4_9GAMM|nr:proton-conducting transporter membrane subunit [Thioalkalivibrio paradoxus]AHE96984.1 NADH-ubiquinone oxidoreductase [Thioalkalivibrio paradoxus ARh 1]